MQESSQHHFLPIPEHLLGSECLDCADGGALLHMSSGAQEVLESRFYHLFPIYDYLVSPLKHNLEIHILI